MRAYETDRRFNRVGIILWGARWLAPMAGALGITPSTLRHAIVTGGPEAGRHVAALGAIVDDRMNRLRLLQRDMAKPEWKDANNPHTPMSKII